MMTYSNRITEAAKRKLGGRCKHCGIFEGLEFAHKYWDGYKDLNPNGRRLSGRSLIQKHNKLGTLKESIMLLCRKCHREYDTITMAQFAKAGLQAQECTLSYAKTMEMSFDR
uniref:HNH endonuclease n=1 Tax=Nitrosopumivirus cobalaminus TaxID=3158414 RepID=A0AAU7N467_9VIRU